MTSKGILSNFNFTDTMEQLRIVQRFAVLIIISCIIPTYSFAQTNSLIGYWKLDGDAMDASGNNNHGVMVNATQTNNRFNEPGKALYFNGSSEIGFGDILDMGTDDLTISVWFKLDANSTDERSIFAKSYYSDTDHRYGVGISGRRIHAVFDLGSRGSNLLTESLVES